MKKELEILSKLGEQLDKMVQDGIPDQKEYERVSDEYQSIQMEVYLNRVIYGNEDV